MNRKEALKKLTGAGMCLSMPLIPSRQGKTKSAELDNFLQRWEVCKEYSLKVLDKMPEEYFSFKPTPEQMSFGQQFAHAGYWNTLYAGIMAQKPPLEEPKHDDKLEVVNYVVQTFDHCAAIFSHLTSDDLKQKGRGEEEYWQSHSGWDFLLRAYSHTCHHRGQAIIYLRLKGIEPPAFEF